MKTETCLFCAIATRQLPSFIVYEDDVCLAFLDKRPVFYGHSLLIPKMHFPTFYDLPQALLTPFFLAGQKVGYAIEQALQAQGSFVAMNNRISQSVPHLHMHIVPRKPKDGLKGFFWPRHTYQNEHEMYEIQQTIIKCLEK